MMLAAGKWVILWMHMCAQAFAKPVFKLLFVIPLFAAAWRLMILPQPDSAKTTIHT